MSNTMPSSQIRSKFLPFAVHWRGWIAGVIGLGCAVVLIHYWLTQGDYGSAAAHGDAPVLPPLWGIGITPFAIILAAIAFLPLLPTTLHWWEDNVNRLLVSLFCAVVTIAYVALTMGYDAVGPLLEHAIIDEYGPFIALLFALYVISGGIRLSGDLPATPWVNATFLAVGTLLASFIGTTGASMLLIRPLLQTNQERTHVLHTVIFFIFLVSNIGGTLLPIGDPPLFLGYLRGVPFDWTLRLLPEWTAATSILLLAYYLLDRRMYRREPRGALIRDVMERKPLRFQGMINFLWLGCVVLAVAFLVPGRTISLAGASITVFPYLREIAMLILVILSLVTTPQRIRDGNQFSYHAILEVAALFIGIFVAMQIPLAVLRATGADITQNLNEPWQFFWATGSLSAFLDNAPTYAVFFELARTLEPAAGAAVVELNTTPPTTIPASLLIAISLGSVFMGAMTYIGNGPNFMVKSIAERAGVKMPSFFGFMIRYSIPILVPVFILVMVLFLL